MYLILYQGWTVDIDKAWIGKSILCLKLNICLNLLKDIGKECTKIVRYWSWLWWNEIVIYCMIRNPGFPNFSSPYESELWHCTLKSWFRTLLFHDCMKFASVFGNQFILAVVTDVAGVALIWIGKGDYI